MCYSYTIDLNGGDSDLTIHYNPNVPVQDRSKRWPEYMRRLRITGSDIAVHYCSDCSDCECPDRDIGCDKACGDCDCLCPEYE